MHFRWSRHVALFLVSILLLFNEQLGVLGSQTTGAAGTKQTGKIDGSEKPKENLGTVGKTGIKEHLTAELAVFTDKAFSARFDNKLDRMLEYLQILLIDVHTRVRTLPSISLSFRVNMFNVLEVDQGKKFISYREDKKHHVDIRSTLNNFQLFTHIIRKSMPQHDIAMLLLGAPVYNDVWGASFQDGVCQVDDESKRVRSNFVVSLSGSENIAVVVAREIAHLLGVKYDDNEECHDDEEEVPIEPFIMNRKFSPKSTHFSPCSNRQMARFLKSEQADCLRRYDHRDHHMTFFNTSSSDRILIIRDDVVTRGIPVDEQCNIIQKDRSGWCLPVNYFWKGEDTCEHSKRCISGTTCLLNPLDSTPCGTGESRRWCFRGKCVPVGVKLSNVQTEECIISKNLHVSGDAPKMGSCDALVTPLDLITIRDMGPELGKFLVMSYNLPKSTESLEKCLVLRPQDNRYVDFKLTFAKCPDINEVGTMGAEFFGWKITLLESGYLVSHFHFKNVCLKMLARKNMPGQLFAATCSKAPGKDEQALWLILNEGGKFIGNLTEFIDGGEIKKKDAEGDESLFSKAEILFEKIWKWKDEL